MTRRSMAWLALAVLFALGNFAGAVYAAAQGELWPHAGIHVGLTLLGAYAAWWLTPRRDAREFEGAAGSAVAGMRGEPRDRLTHREQSVDAVAVEVERIGEGQRFMTRFFTERGLPRSAGEAAAEPITPRVPAPPDRRD
ncbi:MAG: hypothetical protein NVS4B3_08530 [Gemmatimonadaceae bacterium]